MSDATNIAEKLNSLYKSLMREAEIFGEKKSFPEFLLMKNGEYLGALSMAEEVMGYVVSRDENGNHTVSLEPDFTAPKGEKSKHKKQPKEG